MNVMKLRSDYDITRLTVNQLSSQDGVQQHKWHTLLKTQHKLNIVYTNIDRLEMQLTQGIIR